MKNKKETKKSFMDSFEGMKKEQVNKILGGGSGDTTDPNAPVDPTDRRAHQTVKIIREVDPA
jgi:hypothetical protein